MTIPLPIRLITVEEYNQMGEAGILKPEERVELIQGQIIKQMPKTSYQASINKRINHFLSKHLHKIAILSLRSPVQLSRYSEPEPDIALLKPSPHFYEEHHPQAEDVFLIIEVAKSSIKTDRDVKLPLYAASKIPEVWLIDVKEGRIEVYREPDTDFYAVEQIIEREDEISIAAFDLVFPAKEILG